MKVVILAGGFGTRISEYTDLMPKPMIQIGGKPILWHIMNSYSKVGFNDFYIALGYKSEVIKDYFYRYQILNSNFKINLKSGDLYTFNSNSENWNIHLIETGLKTMTGGRLKRLKDFIGDETFMLTYGDGVANVDINELLKFHKNHGKMITMTAVRPSARFGELEISNGDVLSFKEKPQLHSGWINGGFFVIEPRFIDLISNDDTLLEREPLEKAVEQHELKAFKHEGFWQCMDTKRDYEYLEQLWSNGNAPWK